MSPNVTRISAIAEEPGVGGTLTCQSLAVC